MLILLLYVPHIILSVVPYMYMEQILLVLDLRPAEHSASQPKIFIFCQLNFKRVDIEVPYGIKLEITYLVLFNLKYDVIEQIAKRLDIQEEAR